MTLQKIVIKPNQTIVLNPIIDMYPKNVTIPCHRLFKQPLPSLGIECKERFNVITNDAPHGNGME